MDCEILNNTRLVVEGLCYGNGGDKKGALMAAGSQGLGIL